MKSPRFDAVLFDCDGVLVDSEPITNGVLRQMLAEAGWAMSVAECMRLFVGKAINDERALIEARIGRPLTEAWFEEFRERRNTGLRERLQVVPGAQDAVAALHARYAGRIACASGADLYKVQLQLEKVGLMPWFDGRIFSGHELPRSKPHPDVYLAAAAALGVAPERCAVVEDTVTGATAGVRAGATVFGYCPEQAGYTPLGPAHDPAHDPEHDPAHEAAAALLAAGCMAVFTRMDELPALLR